MLCILLLDLTKMEWMMTTTKVCIMKRELEILV